MNRKITGEMVMGCSEDHLANPKDSTVQLHIEVIEPWLRLKEAASRCGLELQIASGFRSFERQLVIWNAKASGKRPVLDDHGMPVDINRLDERDRVMAILRWSGLPGASRHHWGTDIDVWDKAAVPDNYQLQLTPEEYRQGGPFYRLCEWLDVSAGEFGFYRPYAEDLGGVAPEPWHLSYQPVADKFERLVDRDALVLRIKGSDLLLKNAVLDNLDEIMNRFVRCSR